jgi:hypothetical protein
MIGVYFPLVSAPEPALLRTESLIGLTACLCCDPADERLRIKVGASWFHPTLDENGNRRSMPFMIAYQGRAQAPKGGTCVS